MLRDFIFFVYLKIQFKHLLNVDKNITKKKNK